MIEQILDLLNTLEFHGSNENIHFAKGAYRYPRTFKETIKTAKRWLLKK